MKVDGITLLQMIKAGKIKNTDIYTHGKKILWGENGINSGEDILVWESEYKGKKITVDTYDLLNNEFEIELIEEDKPIEKLDINKINTDLNFANHYSKANMKNNLKYVTEKINEIIAYLKKGDE